MDGRPRISVRDRTRLTGRSPGTRSPADAQSSSARQMPLAVQALQIGRASTNEPSGNGKSRPPRGSSPGPRVRRDGRDGHVAHAAATDLSGTGIGVRWGASLRSTAMRARACAADRGMLNGAFVPWTEGSLDQVKRRRRGAILESCSGGAASRRSRRPMPSARRCSKSSPNGRNRSVRSSGWPPEFEPKATDDHRCYAFGEPEPLSVSSSATSACSWATPTARGTCEGCWSFRPMSSRLCAALRRRFRRRLLPTDGRPRSDRKAAGEWSRPSSSSSSSSAAVSGMVAAGRTWRGGGRPSPTPERSTAHPPDRVDHAIGRGERCGHAGDIHHWASSFNLTGAATRIDDVLRMTPSAFNEASAAWFPTPVPVAGGSCRLHGDVRQALESGGDGIAVVVQTVSPGVVGSSGRELGFGGLAGSLAVEFDVLQHVARGQRSQPQSRERADCRRWRERRRSRVEPGRGDRNRRPLRRPTAPHPDHLRRIDTLRGDRRRRGAVGPGGPYDRLPLRDGGTAYIGFTASTGDAHRSPASLRSRSPFPDPRESP